MILTVTISPDQVVNGRRATVDTSQYFTSFAAQMPAQREGVQVAKQIDLNQSIGVLLHADPDESAYVTDKSRGT